jgi:RNA polymerase sigma-54 factor
MKQSMGLTQSMRLEQKLSPQMVMQMNLLVLPLLDFNAELESLADDNPVLELQRPAEQDATDAPTQAKTESEKDKQNDEWDERVLQRIAELGEDPSHGGGSWAGGTSSREEEWTDPILRVAPTKTLTDDLLEQVRLNLRGKESAIGEFIVQDLDSRGFITRPLAELTEDIHAYAEISVTEAEVAEVLEKLKTTLEPPGVCAANVEESIGIQLQRRNKSKWVDMLVKGYQLLAAGKERELVRLCHKNGVEPSFVFEELEKLHFVPTFGVADEAFDTNSVRPEVLILKANPDLPGPEKYEVRYNSNAAVNLTLNRKIIEMARRRKTLTSEERQFLQQKVQQAKWLKQVIDDRRSLLLRTVQILVDRQWEFLDRGRRYLKPLTQREVAEEVGRDESTISRLISGRFADTPQECLPLSAFFSQAVGHASGAAAREVLKDIMDTETAGTAFTDDELAEMMRRRGFAIQRRTVNKYRRMLGGHYALKRSVRRAMNRAPKPDTQDGSGGSASEKEQ